MASERTLGSVGGRFRTTDMLAVVFLRMRGTSQYTSIPNNRAKPNLTGRGTHRSACAAYGD